MTKGVAKHHDGTRHGTVRGHGTHLRKGEDPCELCRLAKSEYDERWRSAPAKVRDNRLHARAQHRALADLRERHLAEYRGLYEFYKTELRREHGLEPGEPVTSRIPRQPRRPRRRVAGPSSSS